LVDRLAPQAPPALSAQITETALSAVVGSAGEGLFLADRVSSQLLMTKAKTIAAYAAALLIFCGLCGVFVHRLITVAPSPPVATHSVPENR
jgi:hypothetical protein